MKYTLTLIFLLIISCNKKIAYDGETPKYHREILVNYEDSIAKTFILLKSKKIEPDNSILYYWFAYNNINTNYGGFEGYLLDGEYSVFDVNHHLITNGFFIGGKKDGVWKKWNSDGKIISVTNWSEGLKHGKESFYTNGQIVKEVVFKNGVVLMKSNNKTSKRKNKTEISQSENSLSKADTIRNSDRKPQKEIVKDNNTADRDTTKIRWFRNIFKRKNDPDTLKKVEKITPEKNTSIPVVATESKSSVKKEKSKKVKIPQN